MRQYKYVKRNIPLVVATAAYSASDVVGGLLTCKVSGFEGGGFLYSGALRDANNQSEPYLLYVYDTLPATIADADPFTWDATEVDKCIGVVDIPAAKYFAINSIQRAHFSCKDKYSEEHIVIDSDVSDLWFYLVANGSTPDYAAITNLKLDLFFCLA